MARVYPMGGGAPGIDPTALTATAGDVISGVLAGVKDNYDPVVGTLTLTGNAQQNHVLAGETYYTTNPKSKITGTMNIQSILSFSCAPYSASQIILTWQNPYTGPFSGVIIIGKTGGYPANINDGTRLYKGFGNNTSGGGVSNTVIGGFELNVTYYFRAFSYTTVNGEEWLSGTTRIANVIIQQISSVFTSSGTFTVPPNVSSIDVFCVGGGGTGSYGQSDSSVAGDGGNSGRTNTVKNVSVYSGQQFNVIIGAGGPSDRTLPYAGEPTSFGNILTVQGGDKVGVINQNGGGSGGGVNYSRNHDSSSQDYSDSGGGVDGSDGETSYRDNGEPVYGGTGQHYTTRAFGEASGTLYAGGGAGGGNNRLGAPGGGGNGGGFRSAPTHGTPNTGGGGGGGGRDTEYYNSYSGAGGSGICIVRYIG